jgi:MFS family permease
MVASVRFVTRYHGLFCVLIAIDFFANQAKNLLPMEPEASSLQAFAEMSLLPALVWSAVLYALVAALSAPIVLAAHRSILTGDTQAPYDFSSRRSRSFMIAVVGYLFVLFLIWGASALAFIAPAVEQDGLAWGWWVIGASLFMIGIVLAVRVLIAFPLIAIDEPSPWRRSLAMTRGRWWRILNITGTPALAAGAAAYLATIVASVLPSHWVETIVVDLANAIADSFLYVNAPCVLSLIYLWIKSQETRAASSAIREAG